MMFNFSSSVIFVADVARSRKFYEDLLGQTVLMNNGLNVIYARGFSIWQRDSALPIIFAGSSPSIPQPLPPVMELYFESAELEEAWARCSSQSERIIHPIFEHPWGQKGFRIYDPDGVIIDISEPLGIMVKRLIQQGLTIAEIAVKAYMPEADVRALSEE